LNILKYFLFNKTVYFKKLIINAILKKKKKKKISLELVLIFFYNFSKQHAKYFSTDYLLHNTI